MSELTETTETLNMECETVEYEWQYVYEKKVAARKDLNLMNTKWLLQTPHDLEENWLIKCVPQGYRILLVASRKSATCYTYSGKRIFKVPTNLSITHKYKTILDCIYHRKSKTIFVLDCLRWNTRWLMRVEARYRFFWLEQQFRENTQFSSCNFYKFVLIPAIPAKKSLIEEAMSKTFQVNDRAYYYDGVAFYHKSSLYIINDNEHVGWLASFMLTEILEINVSQQHLVKKPENYKSASQHLEDKARKKLKNKLDRRKRKRMRRYCPSEPVVEEQTTVASQKTRPKKKRRRKKKKPQDLIMMRENLQTIPKSTEAGTDVPISTEAETNIPVSTAAEIDVPVSTEEQHVPTGKKEKGKKRRHTEGDGDFPKRTKVEMEASSSSMIEKDAPESFRVEKDTPGSARVEKVAPASSKVEKDTPGSSKTAMDVHKEKKKAKDASEKVVDTKKVKKSE